MHSENCHGIIDIEERGCVVGVYEHNAAVRWRCYFQPLYVFLNSPRRAHSECAIDANSNVAYIIIVFYVCSIYVTHLLSDIIQCLFISFIVLHNISIVQSVLLLTIRQPYGIRTNYDTIIRSDSMSRYISYSMRVKVVMKYVLNTMRISLSLALVTGNHNIE